MPLVKKDTQKAHSSNVKEMIKKWKESGKIGNTKPKNLAQALRIANAAAYSAGRK